MTSRSMPYLLALLGLLLAAVAVDRLFLSAPDAPTTARPAALAPAVPDPAAPQDISLNPVTRLPVEAFDDLFARPLFAPDRLPAAPEAPAGVAEDAAPDPAAESPSAALPPVLLGTVAAPAPGGAFLSDPGSGDTAYVAPGALFGDWKLVAVGPDWAELDGPGGPLRLAFPDPAAGQAGGEAE